MEPDRYVVCTFLPFSSSFFPYQAKKYHAGLTAVAYSNTPLQGQDTFWYEESSSRLLALQDLLTFFFFLLLWLTA